MFQTIRIGARTETELALGSGGDPSPASLHMFHGGIIQTLGTARLGDFHRNRDAIGIDNDHHLGRCPARPCAAKSQDRAAWCACVRSARPWWAAAAAAAAAGGAAGRGGGGVDDAVMVLVLVVGASTAMAISGGGTKGGGGFTHIRWRRRRRALFDLLLLNGGLQIFQFLFDGAGRHAQNQKPHHRQLDDGDDRSTTKGASWWWHQPWCDAVRVMDVP